VVLVGAAFAVLAALSLSVQALLIRRGTLSGRSFDALAGVLAVNVAILVPLALLTASGPAFGLTVTSVLAFVGAGIVGTLLGRIFYFAGIKSLGASRAEPIKASQPLCAVLVAVVALGEVVTVGRMVGIVLVIAGVALVTWSTQTDAQAPDASLGALALPVAAAFFLGLEPTFAKTGFAEGTDPIVGLAVKSVVAELFVGSYLVWDRRETLHAGLGRLGDWSPGRERAVTRIGSLPAVVSRWFRGGNVRWFVTAGCANTLFLLAYYEALRQAPVGLVTPILQISPILVAILSLAFLADHERVTRSLLLGTTVVVVGAIVVVRFG